MNEVVVHGLPGIKLRMPFYR